MMMTPLGKSLLGFSALLAGVTPVQSREPAQRESTVATSKQGRAEGTPARAVSRLVEQLKQNPAKRCIAPDRLGLYLIDVTNGEVLLIADEPDPGLIRCGSPEWSHDGKRIVFDAMPMNQVPVTRLKSIELSQGRPVMSDLGLGNCPTFSPSDDRIAFLNNSEADRTSTGVWIMQADGSGRRPLGEYGRPRWSPDSRQFMIVSFGKPRQVTLMDVRPEKSGPLELLDQKIFWEPSWADAGTIVAATGSGAAPDTIALIDVSDSPRGKIKEVLWTKPKGVDLTPNNPVYSPATRRCVFAGTTAKGMALYTFLRGQLEPPKRLEPDGFDKLIQDLACSPDGRYVLFSSNRPERPQRVPKP
jgi:hypothetical protein